MSFLVNFLSDDGDSDSEYYMEEFNRHHESYKKLYRLQDTKSLDVSIMFYKSQEKDLNFIC